MTAPQTPPNPAGAPGGTPRGLARRALSATGSALTTLGGGDADVIALMPAERSRFVKAGCAQLSAAAVSATSMAVALHMIFRLPVVGAVAGGVAWGAGVILPMDVYLVALLQRQSNRFTTAMLALPRMAMAAVSAFSVAVPITLAAFGSGVVAQVAADNQRTLTSYEQRLDAQPEFAAIPALNTRVAALERTIVTGGVGAAPSDPVLTSLQQRVTTLQSQYMAAERQAIAEDAGEGITGRAGAGPVYQQDVAIADQLHAELQQAQTALQTEQGKDSSAAVGEATRAMAVARQELPGLRHQLAVAQADRVSAIAAEKRRLSDGLSERLQALWELALAYPLDRIAHLALTMLFMGVETLPVLGKTLKLLGSMTAYEQAENLLREAQLNNLKDRLRAENELTRRVRQAGMDEQVRAEQEVARHFYDRWAADQKVVVDLDPARFVL